MPVDRSMPTILVVEDDRDCRDLLCTWLETNGYSTIAAGDGAQALAKLEERPDIELILLDLMMPGMSGWQFRSSQRGLAQARKIPIIVMTGHPNPDGEAEWLDPEGVLLKPLDLRVVLNVVSRCCGPAFSDGAAAKDQPLASGGHPAAARGNT
jgi:CheY-like chemotaxis protein